jgi:predicted PurR-regulated permease PerM
MRGTALQNGFFIALLVLTTAAFIGLISGFLMPVFWAAVLAVIFRPLYRAWLEKMRGRSSLAAVATILIVVVLVILPLLFLGVMVSRETGEFYQRFTSGELSIEKQLQTFRQSAPRLSAFLTELGIDREETRQGIAKAGDAARQFLTSNALSMGQGAVRFTILLVVMLYLLFFFLRDGDRLVNRILRALPLSPAREQKLLERFAEVSRATIKGTFITGAVQGTIGGLLFWVLGIPAPILWGALMAFLSFLPAFGSAVIWGPGGGYPHNQR